MTRPFLGNTALRSTALRRTALPGIAALTLGSLILTGCGAANESSAGASENGGLSGSLSGAGASTQEAAMSAWQKGFQSANPDVTVNYDPIGSGGGREQFLSGAIAFAGSDAYLSEEDGEVSAARERCGGRPAIEIPDYVSPIALAYNVEGVDDLRLSGETLARIFTGDITRWDDPAITQENPEASLPDARITPVHRSDDSGTTENFTSYLSAAAPGVWTDGQVGVWPIKGGEAAKGTSGVVAAVNNGANTIGYADASQAGDLAVASVKVGDSYVGPSAEAAAKVLEVSPRVEGRPDTDMATDLDRSTRQSGAYPVVLTSYLIACQSYEDQQTADLVKGYLSYVVSEEGQQAAAQTAGSAPLSSNLREQAQQIIDRIGSSS